MLPPTVADQSKANTHTHTHTHTRTHTQIQTHTLALSYPLSHTISLSRSLSLSISLYIYLSFYLSIFLSIYISISSLSTRYAYAATICTFNVRFYVRVPIATYKISKPLKYRGIPMEFQYLYTKWNFNGTPLIDYLIRYNKEDEPRQRNLWEMYGTYRTVRNVRYGTIPYRTILNSKLISTVFNSV
jgi:hypothetical protein